jgi:hypothetical protein
MERIDFTNSTEFVSLTDAAEAHPSVDHFHIVEKVDGKEYVFHFNVLRENDGTVIILDEAKRDCNPVIAGNLKVLGDEAHD